MSKTITLDFASEFIYALMGNTVDRIEVPESLAHKILQADSNEQYLHIESPNARNSYKWQAWRIADWQTDHRLYELKKSLADLERNVFTEEREYAQRIARYLRLEAELDESDGLSIGWSTVKKRNYAKIYVFLGTKAASLKEADRMLAEFKILHNLKGK